MARLVVYSIYAVVLSDVGSIPDQGKITNDLVFYHEVNMIF